MSRAVIHVEGLGKRYRIGEREPYPALRNFLGNALRAPVHLLRTAGSSAKNHQPQHIWALKDVSFEVNEGEVVGIIGRNGAGKTTLLKILARVTRPTEGYAEVRGRMGSLLEVGTGFHFELTGRENVYLSGAILGMKKKEIERKFDEIVAFAEVEKFIDTPLKHYSTGMQTRLAFAVAAHLEPEILLIDEVLAVGDIAFQKKCLGKMGDIAKGGRTILFVSHNLGAVGNLCARAIWVKEGRMALDGPAAVSIEEYSRDVTSLDAIPLRERRDRIGDGRIRFVELRWESAEGSVVSVLQSGEDYNLVLNYESEDGAEKGPALVSFAMRDHSGTTLLLHQSNFNNQLFELIPPHGSFICRIPRLPLAAGDYSVAVYVGTLHAAFDHIEDAAHVAVEGGDFFGTGSPGRPSLCKILTDCRWDLRR